MQPIGREGGRVSCSVGSFNHIEIIMHRIKDCFFWGGEADLR